MVLLEGVRSMCCRRTNHVQVHVSGSLLFISQKLASFGSSIPETFDNPCRNQFVRATKLLACSAFALSQCPSPRGRRVITIVPGVLETYGPSSTVKALDSCIMTIDVHGLEGGGCNSGVSRPGRQNLSQANETMTQGSIHRSRNLCKGSPMLAPNLRCRRAAEVAAATAATAAATTAVARDEERCLGPNAYRVSGWESSSDKA